MTSILKSTTVQTTNLQHSGSNNPNVVLYADGSVLLSGATQIAGVSGSLSVPMGASGTPSIVFTGDTNTGFYSPAVDTLGFVEGGNEVARINNSGILLVNTTTATGNAKVQVSGDVSLAGDCQLSSVNSGPLAGFRNAIINGNFDFWQRGTSFTGLEYGADRWINNRNGSSCTMSRQAFTLGQTDVPGEPTYFCRMAVTSVASASNYVVLSQRLEGVRSFAGQQITVGFWAKADASKPISVELEQYFGSGGSPSSAVSAIGVTKTTLGTSWQKVTVTATMPSISGKTLGSNGDDFVSLNIWFDAGSNFNSRTSSLGQQSGTFDIAQVQVERGPVATPFERRPIGTELALCQRYYCKTFNTNTAPANSAGLGGALFTTTYAAGGGGATWKFPVEMRGQPTVSTYNPSANNGNWRDVTNGVDRTVGISASTGTTQTDLLATTSAAAAAYIYIHATASAEL